MLSQYSKITRYFFVFVLLGVSVYLALNSFNQNENLVSADNQLATDFLDYLQKTGNVVALDSSAVTLKADELRQKPVAERVLYLSQRAATDASKEELGEIYGTGILIVAIDTPISTLYHAVDTVPLGENALIDSPRKDLEDLVAPNDKLVVVSMIYSYSFLSKVNGYYHHTDFYAYPEDLELVTRSILEEAERELKSEDIQSGHPDEETSLSTWLCNVDASITWTNGNEPGTSPTGFAKCPSGFKPFYIGISGTMHHDCDGWHQVGSLDKWNSTPYTVSEVSGGMTGFPFNNFFPNGCATFGGHKSPLFGTANVTAQARDYSPNVLHSDSASSSKTVYYPQ